jgi:hypothetical protein
VRSRQRLGAESFLQSRRRLTWRTEVDAFATEIPVEPWVHMPGSDLALLGYLEGLTYDFERDGRTISCVLTYAEPDPTVPGLYHAVAAAESGYEGIACVDDTARAALLGMAIYERSGQRRALTLARRWLTFVEYMQYPDGSFANFIRNAAGVRNATGSTSVKGGYWWSVRALWALARAYRLTGNAQYREQFEACHLEPIADGKLQAVLALGELELHAADPAQPLRQSILERCDMIRGLPETPYFRDQPDDAFIHLWGYHQLHAVASAAGEFHRPELLSACRHTVQHLIEPDVHARFWYSFPDRQKDGVCAYTVTPIVQGLAAMYRATGAKRYRKLTLDATAWFYGRNDAGTAMYDPTTGMCRDGITRGVASSNYGAESAIEAGFAELIRRDLLASE